MARRRTVVSGLSLLRGLYGVNLCKHCCEQSMPPIYRDIEGAPSPGCGGGVCIGGGRICVGEGRAISRACVP